jgi:hypothetical protein
MAGCPFSKMRNKSKYAVELESLIQCRCSHPDAGVCLAVDAASQVCELEDVVLQQYIAGLDVPVEEAGAVDVLRSLDELLAEMKH